MKTLVQRVRSVMNLLLVWALVLCWVATVEPVDIHRNCLDLEISWNNLSAAAQNGGRIPAASLARPSRPQLSANEAQLLQQFNDQWSLLSRYRYESLDSKVKNHNKCSAEAYVEACRAALDTAREAATADHPSFSTHETTALILSIERQLTILNWHIERLDLGPSATLLDVAHEARPKIAIPGSAQSIPMTGAVAWSLIGLSCVYLYLVSLIRALRDALTEYNHHEACDWLLLHPGLLGPLLAITWLTIPLVALFAAGATVFAVQAVNTVSELAVYFAFVLPASWLWCTVAAFRVRRKFSQLARSQKAIGGPEVSAHNSDGLAKEIAERRLDAYRDAGISLENYRRAA